MPLPLVGAWIPQPIASPGPAMNWALEVGGKWYIGPRSMTGTGFGATTTRDLLEVNADGTYTTYSTTGDEFAWKSAVAYGDMIYIPLFSSATNQIRVRTFNTVTKAFGLLTLATTVQLAGFGKGVIAPDGKLYFPPFGGTSGRLPLVIDPSTNAMSLTNMGGTWPAGEQTGHFVNGGDGRVYFLPGNVTPQGGGFQSGTRMGYITFSPTPSVTLFPLPLPPRFGSSGEADTWLWGMTVPDGIYGCTMGGNFYKITTAGPQFIQSCNPFESSTWFHDYGEITQQVDVNISNAVDPGDGYIYTTGQTFVSSGNYFPVTVWIDIDADEVHFQPFSSMTGKAFSATAIFMFDGKLRTFSTRVGSNPISDVFESTIIGPSGPPDSGFSFYVGDRPVSLFVGDRPVNGWYAV